jgi:hypothetical protein
VSDGFFIDFEDVYTLAAQLDGVKDEIPKGATAAVRGAAYTAKEAWAEGLEDSDVPASASTLSYKFSGDQGSLTATVAPTRGTKRLRGYVRAREFGSPTVSPAAPAATAAESAAEDLAKGLRIAGERAIERALGS